MTQSKAKLFGIEAKYAGVQASYWTAVLAFSGFMTVYLSFKGFKDTQIGLTAALISFLTISFQLFISNFSDAHQQVPIKKIVAGLYILGIVLGALLWQVPLPIPLMMICYATAGGFEYSINGLLNAQVMQYANAGIPVKYGWPRGVGSVVYAFFALLLGALAERHSPAILMPIFLGASLLALMMVLFIPDVKSLSSQWAPIHVQEKNQEHSSYRRMIAGSPVFLVFLIASVALYTGVSPSMLFLVRIVQNLGGGSRELGIAMFLQAAIEMPMMFLSPWLMQRFKPEQLLSFSFASYLIKSILLVFAPSIGILYTAMVMNVFCFGLYGFASVYFVNRLVKPGEKVRAQGLITLCGSLGGIIANLFSGVIMDTWGLKPLLVLSSAIVLISFLLMLVCLRMLQGKKLFDKARIA